MSESVVIRMVVSTELADAIATKYKTHGSKYSEGLKADLYQQFGVAPPAPPTELEKAIAAQKKLERKIAALEEARRKAEKADSTPADKPAEAEPATDDKPADDKPEEPETEEPVKPVNDNPAELITTNLQPVQRHQPTKPTRSSRKR